MNNINALTSVMVGTELHAGRNFVTAARNLSKFSPQPAVLLNSTRGPPAARNRTANVQNICFAMQILVRQREYVFRKTIGILIN